MTALAISGRRGPMRSDIAPTGHDSSKGKTKNIAASTPTAEASAPSSSA